MTTSIPVQVYNLLDAATTTTVAPFVRPHDQAFPCVVYRFDGDTFEGSRYSEIGARRVEVTAHCLARTLASAEAIADSIVAYIGVQPCVRVTRVDREYDPSYDGQRSGIYDVSVSFIVFKG